MFLLNAIQTNQIYFLAIIPEYCSIAGVETFNHCNQVGKEQAQVEECLEESLQVIELFNTAS